MTMVRLQTVRNGNAIMVDDSRIIGRGGEAAVFPVEGDDSRVVKLYHAGFATTDRKEKLHVMLDHPPKGTGAAGVAWPLDELADSSGTFCGFVMPRVKQALLLHELADPKDRLCKAPAVTPRFLLGVVQNLATAVGAVHAAGHVIGDLNANNVCISRTGLVTLVDTDSFEIRGHGRTFPCLTGMFELQPPEITSDLLKAGANFATISRSTGADNWILALLCFSLLTDGEDATNAGTTQAQAGFLGLHTLPPALRVLVERALSAAPAARPSAKEWADAAKSGAKQLVPCATHGERHAHSPQLSTCPYCARAKILGIDTFSGRALAQSPVAPVNLHPPVAPPVLTAPPVVSPPLPAIKPVTGVRPSRTFRLPRRLIILSVAAISVANAFGRDAVNWISTTLPSGYAHAVWTVLPSRYAMQLTPSPGLLRARQLTQRGDTTGALTTLSEGWSRFGHHDPRALLLAGELTAVRGQNWEASTRLIVAAIREHMRQPFLETRELADAFDALARSRCAAGDRRGYQRFAERASQLRTLQEELQREADGPAVCRSATNRRT